jgi:hypothetical protein
VKRWLADVIRIGMSTIRTGTFRGVTNTVRVQAVGFLRAQRIETLFSHLPNMFVLVMLNDALQQLFVLAFQDGFLANFGIGPCDLGDEKIAELHGGLLSMMWGKREGSPQISPQHLPTILAE